MRSFLLYTINKGTSYSYFHGPSLDQQTENTYIELFVMYSIHLNSLQFNHVFSDFFPRFLLS